jgi:hypothetical protein
MTQTPLKPGRFSPVRDRWTRLTAAAVGAVAVGSLIARRAARSAGQAASAATGAEDSGSTEHSTPADQATTVRLRRTGTAAAGRLSAAGRAAWKEFRHPAPGTPVGQDPAVPPARRPEQTGAEGATGSQHASATGGQTKTP